MSQFLQYAETNVIQETILDKKIGENFSLFTTCCQTQKIYFVVICREISVLVKDITKIEEFANSLKPKYY